MASCDRPSSSYEIALAGEVGRALRSHFLALGARAAATTSVFTVQPHEGQELRDVAAMLQAHGLEVIAIRRVPHR